jgi:isoleucyl-tRNA synthetase
MSDAPTNKKPGFKDTLNLPKTAFPMRANLHQNEPQTLKRWQATKRYDTVCDARSTAPLYRFHDGPPYANGAIHIGHLMNKVLKDIVVRSRIMEGFNCPYIPGWDCHGLPIEHKVVTELHAKGKMAKLAELSDDQRRMAIRKACAASAEKFIKLQATQMQRLLTFADYANPYLTMAPAFEAATIDVFADMLDQGLVYRDLKPVHWSIDNQTALAEAELEYEDREDVSVYVNFEACDTGAVGKAFGVDLDETPSFMIWTTTPWTLPANLAIAVGPRYTYALVRMDGTLTVLASEMVETVRETVGAETIEVLGECRGRDLLGLTFQHPFIDRTGPILEADYVTLEDGTGLVHTAPGHGQEDYRTGSREGLPVYCPVQADGTYDDTVPEWLQGRLIWEANDDVVAHLKASGHLVYSNRFMHSYPHDWRSGSPVIFRATEQWFVAVDAPMKRGGMTLRNAALAATEEGVEFIPKWGRNRFRGMLESRPDWCLSRQRAWGLPIPAFKRPDGTMFMTAACARAIAKVFRDKGSDAWFTCSPTELLADFDAPADLDISTLEKMYDIFDVWFESGSSWNAVMNERGVGTPSELYLEGSDQHRGWFQLSLLPSLGATGEPPYKRLLTHGFMVDKNGKKMSKSKGNAIGVEDLLKDFGADVCRWWVSSLAYENDVKVDLDYFNVAGDAYRKIRNTLRFLLGNLADFSPETDAVAAVDPMSIDGWALAEAVRFEQAIRLHYTRFELREANAAIYELCNDMLSAVYLVAVKDRLYCDRADSPRRRQTQTVMHHLAELLCRVLEPIVPHTADEAYRSLHGEDAVLQTSAPLDLSYECDHDWTPVMIMRQAAMKAIEEAKARGIENPLDAGLVIPDPEGTFLRFEEEFADLCGVSRARCVASIGEVEIEDLREEPRCERSRKRDSTVKDRAGVLLSDRDFAAIS